MSNIKKSHRKVYIWFLKTYEIFRWEHHCKVETMSIFFLVCFLHLQDNMTLSQLFQKVKNLAKMLTFGEHPCSIGKWWRQFLRQFDFDLVSKVKKVMQRSILNLSKMLMWETTRRAKKWCRQYLRSYTVHKMVWPWLGFKGLHQHDQN